MKPMSDAAYVVRFLGEKGVQLWVESGELRFKAPGGALARGEIEGLRSARDQIIAYLAQSANARANPPELQLDHRRMLAPVSYSQRAHWNLYQLGHRPAIRQIASATRLRGRLDVDALRQSVGEAIRRHGALRTRIIAPAGILMQAIDEPGEIALAYHDLTAVRPERRDAEIASYIDQLILEPVDVSAGPLFGLSVLKLDEGEHVLVIAMEHIISDAFSRGLLLQELLQAYAQASMGHAISMPPMPLQFADYAAAQSKTEQGWRARHGLYWDRHLAGCERLRFPSESVAAAEGRFGWGTAPIRIPPTMRSALIEWCRQRRTTLAMAVFTAYAALVLRWCEVSDAVIQYITDGRRDPGAEDAIGYFASLLYLRIELLPADSFASLLHRVTQEYCNAYEHADSSRMAAQDPRPGFTHNTFFDWIPRRGTPEKVGNPRSPHALTCSPVPFTHPMLGKNEDAEGEPVLLLYDADTEVCGGMYFPLRRFSMASMEAFARDFMRFLDVLLHQPERRVTDIGLSKHSLDRASLHCEPHRRTAGMS